MHLHEYLKTFPRPDVDFVDGALQDRLWGEQMHALVQVAIASIMTLHRCEWQMRTLISTRVRVSPTRVRVPDVCAVPSSQPMQGVLITPPVVCVEILSPEDNFQRMILKVQDYRAMGVKNIWLIEPEFRECWTIDQTNGGALPMLEDAFTIPGTPVRVAIADIFEEIDAAPKA